MEDTTIPYHELALRASHKPAKLFAGYESYKETYFEAFYLLRRQKLEQFQTQIQTQDLREMEQLIYTVHRHRNCHAVKKELELL